MKVYLIRHTDAVSFENDVVKTDAMRYITPEGRMLANKVFYNLRDELKNIRMIYTSPLIRAVQTAEILTCAASPAEVEINIELRNELNIETSISKIADLLEYSAEYGEVCCVGHEPTMGRLMFYLTGQNISTTGFKKSAVCKINFDVENLKGELAWYYDPEEMNFIYEF